MNIFYFNNDPKQCAMEHCDKHTVKLIVEYAQLLSTAHRVLDGTPIIIKKNNRKKTIYQLEDTDFEDNLYLATHINHPSAKWARHSYENYSWLLNLWIYLLEEYTYRYDKCHATRKLVTFLLNSPKNIDHSISFCPPWRAMPDKYKLPKIHFDYCEQSYQVYFNGEKQHIASWKKRKAPEWFTLIGQ